MVFFGTLGAVLGALLFIVGLLYLRRDMKGNDPSQSFSNEK